MPSTVGDASPGDLDLDLERELDLVWHRDRDLPTVADECDLVVTRETGHRVG